MLLKSDPKIIFLNKYELVDSIITGDCNSLLILDDQLMAFNTSSGASWLTSWYIRKSSHLNCSCIVLIHNLFPKLLRSALLSSTYTVLHENNRDRSTISYLGRQMFPDNSKFLVYAYEDAIRNQPYSHLVLNHSPNLSSGDKFRISNFIFPRVGAKYYISDHSKPNKMAQLYVVPEHTVEKLVSLGILNEENMGIEAMPEISAEDKKVNYQPKQEKVPISKVATEGATESPETPLQSEEESITVDNWKTCEELYRF